MSALLRVEGLYKQYATQAGMVEVLRGIDLVIEAGEFVAVMGPSGSGKSTFMNILGCLDVPSAGRLVLDGRDVSMLSNAELAHLRNEVIGFVFQGFNLLPRSNLTDNVALPLVYRGLGREARRARARAMLDKVGLSGYANFYPNQISGGQQQRVAIARALVNEPKLILADEPTGNLDTKTSDDIMCVLTSLNHDNGITVVLITHEPDVASYAKRLIRIVDGRIKSDTPIVTRRTLEMQA